MVQLFIIYYGLYVINIELPDFLSGVIAVSLNSAAYIAEIIRSGIQAVDKGQMEAARSIGMSKSFGDAEESFIRKPSKTFCRH